MAKSVESDDVDDIDPHLLEQNEGIINAFVHEQHSVLTTPEIEEHVEIGDRQLRRRLDDLEDEGLVGSRKPGRTKLWWLTTEVEEPVSVRYPIVKLIRERLSLQFVLLGGLLGIASVIIITATIFIINYNIDIPFVSQDLVMVVGLSTSLVAALFLVIGGAIAGTVWLFRSLGIEIRYNSDP